jgi:diguanylate cyclase (GGDEF)-like protein
VDAHVTTTSVKEVSLSRVERALLDMRNRRSTVQFVSIITAASVAMSAALTLIISVVTDMNAEYVACAMVTSVVVPLLVAPAVSYEAARIMGALDRAVAELEQLAHVDALTGESNRRHFFARGPQLVEDTASSGEHVLVGMVDIDDFKLVNDTHGHAVGDEVLRRLALQLRDACGDDALIGRLGGDEFALVVRGGADVEARVARIEAACDLVLLSDTVGARATIGLIDAAGLELDDALRQADSALYASKSSPLRGSDRTATHESVPRSR